jgi:hypothetical protein
MPDALQHWIPKPNWRWRGFGIFPSGIFYLVSVLTLFPVGIMILLLRHSFSEETRKMVWYMSLRVDEKDVLKEDVNYASIDELHQQ